MAIAYVQSCVMPAHVFRPKSRPKNRRLVTAPRLYATCVALAALVAGSPSTAGIPAFPGAEGAGALAVGGRGGAVCKVTNLDDSGPGSLRNCIDMEGPRIVIFDVGGTIKLKTGLFIRNPYITVAGQTAPGGGIQIKADKQKWEAGDSDMFRIYGDHVIVRYLRFRAGDTGTKIGNARVVGPASNVILDHVSMLWATNQNWTTYTWSSTGPSNITLQNSIIAEMLHGRVNILAGASSTAGAASSTDIDHHNNFIASAKHRNPSAQFATGRFINNIFYHWSSWAARSRGGVQHDWISNVWRTGPTPPGSRGQQELQFFQTHRDNDGVLAIDRTVERAIHGHPHVYVRGNRGFHSGMDPDTDNWPYTAEVGCTDDPMDHSLNGGYCNPTPEEWRRPEPLPATTIPITERHADELESLLLPIVGASRRLDCEGNWLANRDKADQRVITEYLNGEGTLTDRGEGEEVYGGYPALTRGAACEDSSGDGVPDQWAIANGFDPANPALGATVHASGYTYLELYVNGLQVGPAPPERVEISVE